MGNKTTKEYCCIDEFGNNSLENFQTIEEALLYAEKTSQVNRILEVTYDENENEISAECVYDIKEEEENE